MSDTEYAKTLAWAQNKYGEHAEPALAVWVMLEPEYYRREMQKALERERRERGQAA